MPALARLGIDVFVGIDIAKKSHWACAMTAGGEELFSRSVANNEAAIGDLIDQALVFGVPALAVDTTSSPAVLVLGAAARKQLPVAYVRGAVMRRAAQLYPGEAKTDPKDARVLADFARRYADQLEAMPAGDQLIDRLQILTRLDADFALSANQTLCQLREALTVVSPGLDLAIGKKLASRPGTRDLLERWATPTALKAAGKARVRSHMAKRSPRAAPQIAEDVWAALNAQTITAPAEDTRGQAIALLAANLNLIIEQRRQLGQDIEAAFLSHPSGEILISLPGLGRLTGARVLAEIGDPNRFKNADHLASYAGLVPVDWQSGSTRRTRRTKSGNKRLKDAICTSAVVAKRCDPTAKAHYDKKLAQGKSHNTAVMSLARKRCHIIYAMLTTQTPYRGPTSTP